MTRLTLVALMTASPAFAASGPFFSLGNTDFVVMLGFILFVGIVVYSGAPRRIVGLLDARAVQIKAELDEARALRDEAQTILASFERKQREVQEQADRIVSAAKEEATAAADQAKADLARSIARRLAAAEEQIASAEAGAIREVRLRAVQVAIAAAADVLKQQMTPTRADEMIDAAIEQVSAKMH